MARSPQQVAQEAVTSLKAATFRGGVGSRHAVRVVMIETRPRFRRLLGAGVRRDVEKAAIKAGLRYLQSTLVPKLLRSLTRRQSNLASVQMTINSSGVVTLRQSVLPVNIDNFFDVMRQGIAGLQTRYNDAYQREAKKLTGGRQRREKIAKLLRSLLRLAVLVVPQVRAIVAVATVATSGVRVALEITRTIVDALVMFFNGIIDRCDIALYAVTRDGLIGLKWHINRIESAYSQTVGRVDEIARQGEKLVLDTVAYIVEVIAGTYAGRFIAAISDPLQFALDKVSNSIEDIKRDIIDGTATKGGEIVGALSCAWDDILFGRKSPKEVIESVTRSDRSSEEWGDEIRKRARRDTDRFINDLFTP